MAPRCPTDLRAAVGVLEQRCALRPRQLAPQNTDEAASRQYRGYRSATERFAKTRRLAVLRSRLAVAEEALAAGHPSITVGGKPLWRSRNHLDTTDMTEQQWRDSWDAARMFMTADGESGKAGGNETIRVNGAGRLRIKTPAMLVGRLGTHIVIDAPVRFAHRDEEWAARVAGRQAVRYDISYDPRRGRWYLDASWKTTSEPPSSIEELRDGRVLGTDLNADHLACYVLDASGNPVGEPNTIEMLTDGLAAPRRDGRVRAAITALLDHADHTGCAAVVVENLDFAEARATGRETLGRGRSGKRLRHTIGGIPTRRFRNRLVAMAARRGIRVIEVDPAYTTKWGAEHWAKPLQQTSDPATVTRHHAAAVAIGRRGLGMAIRRRPAGPRSGQRTAAGTPPVMPRRRSGGHGGRQSCSGPPTCPRRGVPVHRKTPAGSGQHRSGRTGLGPAHS